MWLGVTWSPLLRFPLLRFLGPQMEQILVVLLADVFLNFPTRPPLDVEACGPRLAVVIRIFDSRLVVQAAIGGPGEALFNVKPFAGRGSGVIEPRASVETDGVHHQRVIAFVPADRFSEPGGIGVRRMLG